MYVKKNIKTNVAMHTSLKRQDLRTASCTWNSAKEQFQYLFRIPFSCWTSLTFYIVHVKGYAFSVLCLLNKAGICSVHISGMSN